MPSVEKILGLDLPNPAFAFRPSRNAPLPSEITFSRGGAARTLDPISGKFVSKESGVGLIYGGQQGFFRGPDLINYQPHSSDISNWSVNGNHTIEAQVESIIEGQNAQKISNAGGTFDTTNQQAGALSGYTDLTYWIFERGTATGTLLQVRDTDAKEHMVQMYFDWTKEEGSRTAINNGSPLSVYDRNLDIYAPNEQKEVALVVVTYSGADGNSLDIRFNPDLSGNGDYTFFHHAQTHNQGGKMVPPIVTEGSTEDRPRDDFSFSTGDWWNSNGMTFIVKYVPYHSHQSDRTVILRYGAGGGKRFLGIAGNGEIESGGTIDTWDGTDGARLFQRPTAFEENVLVASFTPTEQRVANDGVSATEDHTGALLNDPGTIDVAAKAMPSIINEIRVLPTALPTNDMEIISNVV